MKSMKLPFLDRFLSLWIFLAMALGTLLSLWLPNFSVELDRLRIGSTSLPIAIGLLIMMYPPLAKVELKRFIACFAQPKKIGLSLVLNWIIGPLLMFALSLIFLHNNPWYMVGLILVGLARCIAMVIVWSDLSGANRAFTASLVAINSVFQIVAFSLYATLFLKYLLPLFGYHAVSAHLTTASVAKSVLIYLGIPFAFAILSRWLLVKSRGLDWYQQVYLPKISPLTLIALLYTIILLFAVQGAELISVPLDVLHIATPLIIYFLVMFFLAYYISVKLKLNKSSAISLSFTSASNNFELAIAISIASFGIHSPVALAAVVGPLIEVPVMIALVYVARRLMQA